MTIRYKCEECGSVLKIKDELAGTDGRCPKCKAKFTIPAPETAGATPAAPAPAESDEFDPVAFLMDGGDKPSGPAAAAATARPATTVADEAATGTDGDEAAADREPPVRRPRRSRVSAGATAAESANAMLGGTASSNAKQLLTRSMEESRVRAAEMPEEKEEPGIDYAELTRYIALRAVPALAGIILLTFGLYWVSSGWLSDWELPELGRVSGTVTMNGEPLVGAQVTFTPLDVDASSATAITDEQGEYTLEYLEGIRGAVLGKNRVLVSALNERGQELVEAQTPYGMGSNEIVVVESGSQEVPIEIGKSRTPPPATDE